MYIIANSHLDNSQTAHYSAIAGIVAMTPLCGSESNSSLLRGYLLATLLGIKRLRYFFGTEPGPVDVLVGDAQIAEQLNDKKAVIKILHADNDDLWQQLLEAKKQYEIRFVTSPSESTHLQRLWNVSHAD